MADLFKSKENEFYIELKQERYYFPGEDIIGDVVLDLKKATKTNNIKVSLEGIAEIGGKSITIYSKSVLVAKSPEGEKSYYLDAYTHRFPFKISIPSSSDYKIPSTLEIPDLLKIAYKLTAVHNRPFVIMEMFSSTATEDITILEDINVQSNGWDKEHNQTRELTLTGETRKVRVVISLGKRAAVKGDTIPVTITVHHIGVMVRDRAIKLQLMRYVYYGKNKGELFGPKVLAETVANIEISGPFSFTKAFDLKLPIPSALTCPTVDESCDAFKIEYCIRATINLNEESPLRKEEPNDIVSFNIPFTIGTHPKLAFNIDDDEEEEDLVEQMSEININSSSEYDLVFEKMKGVDLESVNQQEVSDKVPDDSPYKPDSPAITPESVAESAPEKSYENIKPLPRLQETPPATPTQTLSTATSTPIVQSPVQDVFRMTPASTPPVQHKVTVISPPVDYPPISPVNHSKRSIPEMSPSSTHSHQSSIHRQESMRWVARSEEEPSPDISHSSNYPKYRNIPSPTSSTLRPSPMPTPSHIPSSFSTPQLMPDPTFPSPYSNLSFQASTSQTSLGNLPEPHYPPFNHHSMPLPPPAFPPGPQFGGNHDYNHHPLNPTYAYYGTNTIPPNQGYPQYPLQNGHPNIVSFPTPNYGSHSTSHPQSSYYSS